MGIVPVRWSAPVIVLVMFGFGYLTSPASGPGPEGAALQTGSVPEDWNDPHGEDCAQCHLDAEPGTEQRTARDWANTCQNDACHPRAWTETVFHRLDPDVFIECVNCHRPHAWAREGADCASCHGGGPEAALAAFGESFDHSRHTGVPCARCHASESKHATPRMTGIGDCRDCHHGPESGASECATCHAQGGRGAPGEWAGRFTFSARTPARARTLPFDHERHAGLDCETCHATGGAFTADCASCHAEHHEAQRDCRTCHQPPPERVHQLSVHRTTCAGAGCHGSLEMFDKPRERAICLACHVQQEAHYPGKDCVQCHKLDP